MLFLRNEGSKIGACKDASCILDTNWCWQEHWKCYLAWKLVIRELSQVDTDRGLGPCVPEMLPALPAGEELCSDSVGSHLMHHLRGGYHWLQGVTLG